VSGEDPTPIEIAKPQTEVRRFPKVELVGGPMGKTARLTIDGVEPPKIHRIEIEADVRDIIHVKTYQFAEIRVEVEAPRGLEDAGYVVEIRVPDIGPDPDDATQIVIRTWRDVAHGKGATIREAVLDAAERIPPGLMVPTP